MHQFGISIYIIIIFFKNKGFVFLTLELEKSHLMS